MAVVAVEFLSRPAEFPVLRRVVKDAGTGRLGRMSVTAVATGGKNWHSITVVGAKDRKKSEMMGLHVPINY